MTDRREQQRIRILRAAEALFLARGYASIPLDEIVREVRTSRRAIYEHFGSKQGLLEAVVRQIGGRLEASLQSIVDDGAASVGERMLRIARAQAETTRDLGSRFVDEVKAVVPEVWEIYEAQRRRRVERYYRPLVQEAIETGVFDASLGEAFLLELYLGLSAMVTYTDFPERAELAKGAALERILGVFLRGAAAEGRAPCEN